MSKSSFYEILEDRIREDLRAEIEKEVEAKLRKSLGADGSADIRSRPRASTPSDSWAKCAAERVETWLASNVDPSKFKMSSRPARHAYARDRQTPSNPHIEVKNAFETTSETFLAKTAEELCAVELLARFGGGLQNPFTEKELKSSWRKAALKTHPDRFANSDGVTQAQTAVLFRELSRAFDTLEARMISARTSKAA